MKNLYIGIFFIFTVCLSVFPDCRMILAQSPPAEPVVIQTAPTTSTTGEDLKRLKEQVLRLELDLAKASKGTLGSNGDSSLDTAIITGLAYLGAALLAGLLTLISAYFTAKREERRAAHAADRALELARQEALFQHGEKFLEFRLKQMGLFYAPMFALLEQSKALRNKMYHQLANDEPGRYREVKSENSDGSHFQVLDKNEWKEFRLLDQLPAVRANPMALALVERILQIGEKMTNIISEHAGLASEDLVDLLGEYLAHYAILSMIYKRNETNPYQPGWHKTGYYPRPLNEKIIKGYQEISRQLNAYEEKTKQVLEAFPNKDGEKRGYC